MDVRHIYLIGGLVTRNPPENGSANLLLKSLFTKLSYFFFRSSAECSTIFDP